MNLTVDSGPMVINWISPLPPARSGIADFTRLLLPHLQKDHTVRLWTAQENISTPSAEVVLFRPGYLTSRQESLLENSNHNFYNFGNNGAHHAEMLDLYFQYPGCSIMHDGVLSGLFFSHFQTRNCFPHLFKLFDLHFQPRSMVGHRKLQSRIDRMLKADGGEFLSSHIRENSPRIWVHTDDANKHFPKAKKIPLMYPPRPFRTLRPQNKKTIDITLFGALNAVRPIIPLLESLAAYKRKKEVTLHIIGQFFNDSAETSESEVRKAIRRLRLVDRVAVHGFVSAQRLEELLGMMDLAINLRSRSHGESSFSQLQVWSYALPSVVSDIGWFRELPDGIVTKISANAERRTLHETWDRLLDKDPELTRQGERGLAYLRRHHSPEAYVKNLLGTKPKGRVAYEKSSATTAEV